MVSGYEAQVGFTERKFLISVIIRRRKVSETSGAEALDELRQSNGYPKRRAICGRTRGKETKAKSDNPHLPMLNANRGYPKRERREKGNESG